MAKAVAFFASDLADLARCVGDRGVCRQSFRGRRVGNSYRGGSIGCVCCLLCSDCKRDGVGQLKRALLQTAKLSVMIFAIIWGVLIYVRFLASRICRQRFRNGWADWSIVLYSL